MYFTILSLHIIFIVTWFAGLFYIVRLFVYQVEAREKTELEKSILEPQFKLMAKRLWYGITWPSFILTLVFGPWLLYLNPGIFVHGFHAYQTWPLWLVWSSITSCVTACLSKLQNGAGNYTSNFFRIWNEVATLFLVAIVFLIVVKNEVDWVYGTVGFVLFGILLMIAIKVYKKLRERK
jgi:putative membrane protein